MPANKCQSFSYFAKLEIKKALIFHQTRAKANHFPVVLTFWQKQQCVFLCVTFLD